MLGAQHMHNTHTETHTQVGPATKRMTITAKYRTANAECNGATFQSWHACVPHVRAGDRHHRSIAPRVHSITVRLAKDGKQYL